MSPVDLSIVVPAFNEELRLPRTLEATVGWLARGRSRFEIVVVDDGSTDGTRAVCERLSTRIPGLRLLGGPPNRGKGHAVRVGMLAACGAVRVMCDADGAMPPTELPKLIAPVEEGLAAVAIGSRYVGGAFPHGQPLWRRAWSRLTNALMRRALALDILDMHCGYKAFSACAAHDLFSRARIDGWTFDLEVLALAARTGHRVLEVGVRWQDDAGSRVRPLRHLGEVVGDAIALRRNLARDVYRAGPRT